MSIRKITKEERVKYPDMDYVLQLSSHNQYFTAKALKELQGSVNKLLPTSNPPTGAIAYFSTFQSGKGVREKMSNLCHSSHQRYAGK